MDKPAPKIANGKSEKCLVTIDFTIHSILDISEADSYMELAFGLSMTWMDPRLHFLNLKDEVKLNVLSETEKGKIWTPKFIFDNTRDKSATVEDTKREGNVMKIGPKKLSEKDQFTVNTEIFEGFENPIIMKRIYNMRFICEFKLAMYPFDNQDCYTRMMAHSSQTLFVEIDLGNFVYEGPLDLQQYVVIQASMTKEKMADGTSMLIVKMSFGRKLMNSFLTIYMPTILLLCIIHATNYFKDFFFEAVVTVNLTGMLVLTTIFMSVSANLPQTAYVKMIDVWLLFCILIPFFEVLLHTWIDCNRSEKREINHHGTSIDVSDGPIKVSTTTHGVNQEDLISRRENVQVEALKEFYRVAKYQKNVKMGVFIGRKVIPSIIIGFTAAYWIYGLGNSKA